VAANPYLVESGVLVLGLGLFHAIAGERFIVRRLLRRDNLPHLFGDASFTKLTIRYAWHLLTLFCLGAAAILFVASRPDSRLEPAVWILATTFAASGIWGLVSTRGRHWSWLVLLVAAALAVAGAW
jgi:hypothetical protein